MLAASVFGIFLIPGLYVVFQRLRDRVKGRPAGAELPEVKTGSPAKSAAE
jgi:hypothetical protein